MKKILKKNQIIITALVVMVAIAGYLSMTDREESGNRKRSRHFRGGYCS